MEQIVNTLEDFFISLESPILQAFVGGLFTWISTALGASLVFFFKSANRKLLDAALGFTGGVMIAASFWSLLFPAIAAVEKQHELGLTSLPSFLPPAIGFFLGAFFLYFLLIFLNLKLNLKFLVYQICIFAEFYFQNQIYLFGQYHQDIL